MRKIIFLFLAFYTFGAIAQDSLNAKKNFTEAEFYFYDEDYFNALKVYKKLYKADKENANLNYRIGVCYLKSFSQKERKISAISYLEKAVSNTTQNYQEGDVNENRANVDAFIYLGDAYFINGELDKAIDVYKSFTSINQENSEYFNPIIDRKVETCKNAKILQTLPVIMNEENIGEPVNNAYSNFNPIVSKDGKMLVYTSDLRFYKAIFYASKKDGKWSSPRNFNIDVNIEGDCISLALSPDGTIMYVFRDDLGNGNIYSSKFENEKWSTLIKLNKNINSHDLETSVSLSDDGKTMYFSSNRKGGYGSLDIYKSEFNMESSEWGKAENLGPKVNSKFDEVSPFVIDNGNKLYFSSQGHYNMGGYDIFISQLVDTAWTEPLNLGYPINTTDDNFYFFPMNNGKSAYYQIAKENGFGSNDIYDVSLVKPKDEKNIEIVGKIKPSTVDTKIEIYDNVNSKTVAETTPNEEGNYSMKIPYGDYDLIFSSKTFDKKTEKLSLPKVYYSAKLDINPELKYNNLFADNSDDDTSNVGASNTSNAKDITISNFIFEFDKGENFSQKDNIFKLAEYLKTNPIAKIQINAYSDLQGSEIYNKILTGRRANFVKDLLVENGATKENIITKAFGEEKQISVDLGPQTRKYNRRVEFILITKGTSNLTINPLEIPAEYRIK